ncbi:MAG: hypothetical protein H0U74_11325 [Bradymonadaceae bacterium]|nr:hypothetical protein [Lujinxingiaceae bacterium]
MLNWIRYILTALMALTLVVVAGPCLCKSASALEKPLEAGEPVRKNGCACPHNDSKDGEPGEEGCCCGCAGASDSDKPVEAPAVVALVSEDNLPQVPKAPKLPARFRAMVLGWIIDVVDAVTPDAVFTKAYDDPGTVSDLPIYLQLRSLRL